MDKWWVKGGDDEGGLWIGIITRETFDGLSSEQQATAKNDLGYFLYRRGEHGVIVYAKFLDAEAAEEFAEAEGFYLHSVSG